MKNVIHLLMLVVIITPLPLWGQSLIDRIVAVVDKEIITESELNDRLTFVAMQNRIDPSTPGLKKQVLDAMINEKLTLAQARIDSIEVKDDEVTRTLEAQIQNLVRQLGSEQRLEQLYGKSIARIKREYRDEIRNQLLVQRVRQQREDKITVTRREVEEFYLAYKDSLPPVPEEYTISHIVSYPKPDSTAEVRTMNFLRAILDSIRAGGDFGEFARRYSVDATASSGGDLGWAKRGDYVRDFEEVVFSLKEGEISNVIKTQFGFHIVQLLERRGESVHARHILLRVEKNPVNDSAVVAHLRMLKQRAQSGESFAELARKYSEDNETKSIGGDLGTFTADQLNTDLVRMLQNMSEGEISDPSPITTGLTQGYHIVWLRKRKPSHAMNLQDDYRRLEQLALYMKRNKWYDQWIKELKHDIYVEIKVSDLQ
ncbi:MAG: peptidylprolyl isomerase [Bacteroidetes bacterium]|nr:peptidylprolyl isomerase [Bacteroidota bacterium]